jgi:ribA/ribD-fused uncharacterized protein
MTIKFFVKDYGFLSNFYDNKPHSRIQFQRLIFPTVEHAYQSAKQELLFPGDLEYRIKVRNCHTPGKAKRMGSTAILRTDWETVKVDIMYSLVFQKFQDKYLRYLLRETRPVDLEEGNYWHDNFWGMCHCPKCNRFGENNLGKILMNVRSLIE